MGNRDNNGRFAAAQQIRRAPRLSPMEQEAQNMAQNGSSDQCCTQANEPEKVARVLTPTEEAEKALAAARYHEEIAKAAKIQLDAQMQFFGTALEQQSEALFKWFGHQGFWPAGWEPHGNYFDSEDGNSPAAEYRRLKKAEKLALIHSEVSECLEAVRKSDSYNEAEELADVLVRLLDYAGGFGIDLSGAYYRKMLANYHRPHRHGKKF